MQVAATISISMLTATMHSTPAHLSIPPIKIPVPVFRPEKQSRPAVTVQKQEQVVYHKNHIEYDFPSPRCTYSTCDICNISFEFANTRDNETCVSCEVIYNGNKWYNIPLPKCSICETDCYYIHRQCNQPFCHGCKYNFETCPHCKCPI